MKKFSILPVLIATTCLSGCSGSKSDDTLVIDFWHTFGDKPETALLEKAEQFKQLVAENEGVNLRIELNYSGAYADVPNKINNSLADGSMPTMVIAYADHVANYMAKEGSTPGKYVVNLDDYINSAEFGFGTDAYLGDTKGVDDIIASYLDEGRHLPRTGTYILPYMKSTEIMIYNLSIAKVVVPTVFPEILPDNVEEFMRTITWDQLMLIAGAIVENKNDYPTVEYPVYYDSDSNLFITSLYQNNIGYSSITSSGNGQIDFELGENLAKTKEVINKFKTQHDQGLLTTKGTEGKYASNNFKEGKTVFSIGSTGGTGYTIPVAGSFDVGFAKVPTMAEDPERVKYISQGPSICFLRNPSISKEENDLKLKYAWKFAKYITSTKINTKLCVDGSEGYSPVRNSCYTTETYYDLIASGTSYAKAAVITQNDIQGKYFNSAVFTGSATLREQVGGVITNVFNGKLGVDAALTQAINNTKSAMAG